MRAAMALKPRQRRETHERLIGEASMAIWLSGAVAVDDVCCFCAMSITGAAHQWRATSCRRCSLPRRDGGADERRETP